MTDRDRKFCLLGAPGVGKTSIVATLLGVGRDQVATRGLSAHRWRSASGETVTLWDSAASNALDCLGQVFLSRAAGLIGVADATRPETVACAERMLQEAQRLIGPRPALLLINKTDLAAAPAPFSQGLPTRSVSVNDAEAMRAALESLIEPSRCQ